MNPTVKALIERGCDTQLAESLHRGGYTLRKLRTLDTQALDRLGMSSSCQEALAGKRPPIPEDTALTLLLRNAHTCCICHDRTRGVVIHHIDPWAQSQNHAEDNLAILCPVCHDKAHSKKELTRDLTPAQLRQHKIVWEADVRRAATQALFTIKKTNVLGGVWDFFNRQRLLDCASALGVNLSALRGYRSLADDDGDRLTRQFRWAGSMRVGNDSEYSFFVSLLRAICERRDWIDLRDIWSRSEIRSVVAPNSLVVLTGHHWFKMKKGPQVAPGQMRDGHYTRRGIRLQFALDAWESTTVSSYSLHLTGGWTCTSLGIVRSVGQADGRLVVNTTCLAIGTGFTDYQGSTPAVAYTHGKAGMEWEEVEDES